MKLPNGFGTVYKLSGNRRNPYIVRKTVGWELDTVNGKAIQKYITIGFAPTKEKGLEMLREYNKNPYNYKVSSSKSTISLEKPELNAVNLNNLFKLIEAKGINAKKLSDDTGISTGNISEWKKGRSFPSGQKLITLANYFNCSIDYIVGRKKSDDKYIYDKSSELSAKEDRIIKLYREQSSEMQDIIERLLEVGKIKRGET